MTSPNLAFAFPIYAGHREAEALMLADSVRTFGGRLSAAPLWGLAGGLSDRISAACREGLAELQVQLASFGIEPAAQEFPFGTKVHAAAAAESLLQGNVDLLVWMDCDSLVVQEPAALVLDQEHHLGYRPVDHTLIGSPFGESADEFWNATYEICAVPAGRVFPMTTSVDRQTIRPYFNAGLLTVRPERGLLREWQSNFRRVFPDPFFEPFYARSALYRIFLHQAILAGTILGTMERSEIQELPRTVAYPLHMHDRYPEEERPSSLDEAITCRYDQFFDDEGWANTIRMSGRLRSWLDRRLIGRAAVSPT
jgi:hypothetical protein